MAFSELDMLATFGKVGIDATGYGATHDVTFLAQQVDRIKGFLAEYHEAAAHARKDNRFTKEGVKQELAVLAANVLPRLDTVAKVVEQAKVRLAALREKMTINPNVIGTGAGNAAEGMKELMKVLREQEVRTLLRDKDALGVKLTWFEAIEKGDQLTFDAVRSAPVFAPLITADTLAEGESRWADKRDPKVSKEVRDLAKAIDLVERMITKARSHIRSDAGLPNPEDAFVKLA